MSVYEFNLPDVGEGLSEGEVVRWLVEVGETVKADQLLVEVQTDKAIVEIPAPVAGVLVRHGGQANDVIPVGALLAAIEVEDAASQSAVPSAPVDSGPAPSQAAQVVAPTVNAAASAAVEATAGVVVARRPKASPATRKLAREMGVDLATVSPSGSRGQITSDDVRLAVSVPATAASVEAVAPAVSASTLPNAAKPNASVPGPQVLESRVEPLRGLRRQIAQTMDEAWTTVPHIFSWDEIDATALVSARRVVNEELADEGISISFLPFFVKACALALATHPRFNASLDLKNETVTYHGEINIGLATQTDDGLMVTVVHNADQMSLVNIARRIDELAEKARSRRITLDDLSRSTFSISNYGSYGAHMGTPIIRPPESAIAGFGRIRDSVLPVDGEPKVRPVLPYCVSADHRINDGADLGAFTGTMLRYLAKPLRMLALS